MALLLLVSIVVSFLAASAAPTPMYALYAAHWGFSPLATTVVFGVYALAVLSGLLIFGRLSDHAGRRPVLLGGLAGQTLAMALFLEASGLGTLLAARVVQGLAAGLSLGAAGAAMLDLDRRRGALANSFAAGVLAMRETAPARQGAQRQALRSMVPDVRLPASVRAEVAVAAPVLFAVWALAGFYASLGPSLTATMLHSTSVVYGGLSLFILAGVAAGAVLAFNRAEPRLVLFLSIGALIAGVAVTLAASRAASGW